MIYYTDEYAADALSAGLPMTHARILWDNLPGTISASSEADGRPAERAGQIDTASWWQATTAPSWWQIDYGSAKNVDAIGIAAHNIGTAGATIKAQREGASRTNLCTYSESLDNAAWAKTRSTITANALRAPDGTNTAERLTEDTTATATHSTAGANISFTSGKSYVLSAFVKAGERNHIRLNLPSDAFTANRYAQANLTAGSVVLTSASATSGCEDYGNGWWRVWVCATATVTASGRPTVFLAAGPLVGDTSYTGDGTSGAYVWGVQVEEGVTPTSYIPTAASSAASAWHDASRWIAPTDDSAIMLLAKSASTGKVRILCSEICRLGVIYTGKALAMPRAGYTSLGMVDLGREATLTSYVSEGGQLLKRTIQRSGLTAECQWEHLSEDWYRQNFDPFALRARTEPFFLASRPSSYPRDCAYCWVDEPIVPTRMGVKNFMSVSFTVKAHSHE